MSDGGSAASMVDAQLTTTQVLRPFAGFEARYQGQAATLPIAFPGTLDPRAVRGEDGIAPTLLAGVPVPQGSRVLLWLPVAMSPVPPGNAAAPWQDYSYSLVWRFRSLRQSEKEPVARLWHQVPQPLGAPNGATPQLTIPAAFHVLANQSAEPTTGPNVLTIRREVVIPKLDTPATFARPLTPAGAAATIQQGVYDPVTNALAAPMPNFVPFWTDAEGDELIILVTRSTPTGNWDFTAAASDLAFSNLYGTGNGAHPTAYDGVGIILQTGTNP